VSFEIDGLPRPKDLVFRKSISLAAKATFGTRRFWDEVWVRMELRFNTSTKLRVKGDIDNYIKNVLDGLTGIAFEDDSQVSGVTAYWINFQMEGMWIEVEGDYLVDIEGVYEYVYRAGGESFTIPIPRGLDRKSLEEMKLLFRKGVDGYLRMLKHGMPELEARCVLPSISKKFPRKGPRKSRT